MFCRAGSSLRMDKILPAIHFRDLHVQQKDLRGIQAGLLDEFCAGAGDIYLAAEGLQGGCDRLDGCFLIFSK